MEKELSKDELLKIIDDIIEDVSFSNQFLLISKSVSFRTGLLTGDVYRGVQISVAK